MFTGTYLQVWKVAKTVVIPKKSPLDLKKNWRPITLASILGVLVEKTVSAQLANFVEANKILSTRQHGFRSKLSINTAIAEFMNELRKYPVGGAALAILLDARNAFGSIPHYRILEELSKFCGSTPVRWFHSFLSDRSFFVENGPVRSKQVKPPLSGVPQGAGPSPLIFNLVYDYVIQEIDKSSVKLQNSRTNHAITAFADDIGLIVRGRTKEEVYSHANRLGENVSELLNKQASIKIAPEKTCIIGMGKQIKIDEKVNILSAKVNVDQNTRYLGLIISHDCDIENHVKKQSGKMRARSIGCEKMANMGNPIFGAKSFVNIADGLSNFALPVCKVSNPQLKILEAARNDGLKSCLKMHFRQIGRPVNQIELFEKIGGARSVENNLKFIGVSIISTVFETQKPQSLYKTLLKCLYIKDGSVLTPQSFDKMLPKEKSQNWAIFWEKIRSGQYAPFLDFPEDMTTEEKDDPIKAGIWPLNIKNHFNEMPELLRGMIGTFRFQTEAKGWFSSKCQHYFTHGKTCKYCKIPKTKINPEPKFDLLKVFSAEEQRHLNKMMTDTKNAWKIRKRIKAPVEHYWPKKANNRVILDYDDL